MTWVLLILLLLGVPFDPVDGGVPIAPRGGTIEGESHVNLRSGPDLSHPPIAVLRQGEKVVVEREERGWYLVSLADGTRGYVGKTLIRLSEKVEAKSAPIETPVRPPMEPPQVDALESSEAIENDKEVLAPRDEEPKELKRRPMPIIKVLEGKEREILWWIGVALCLFIIGWICGGNYYLRRERIRRNRLRF